MTGDLLLVGSGFLLGVKIIYTKQAVRVVPPPRLILWHDVIGWPVCRDRCSAGAGTDRLWRGPDRGGTGPAVPGPGRRRLLLRGSVPIAERHPAARLSVFAFSTPIFGVLIAWAFREAAPTPWLLVAGAAVATGIALVNWKTAPR
ncbi:MAG: hypothetical protein CM1200mP2_12930 [Planctomycetaceae bacterium]|nr:MAG: hypothetical protein CM1200mP2_12930 [Planctomycetaceae bacterium]